MKKKVLIIMLFVFSVLFLDNNFQLAANLGISTYTAKRIIGILMSAWSIWAVIGIVLSTAGAGFWAVGLMESAKYLAKKYGTKWATMW